MTVYERQPIHHGTRRAYLRGCKCSRCRRAEADYKASLRRDKARGRLRPGQAIAAAQTWKLLRQMLPEFDGARGLASRLGMARFRVRRVTIRVRTMQKVVQLYQATMLEDMGEAKWG